MANQHAANFKAIEGVSVVGGVDVVPEMLAAFCTEHGIANHFTTLDVPDLPDFAGEHHLPAFLKG
ncbi:hypothetical protein ACC690_37245, partial [Rhizobium johnstonii]